LQLSKEEYAYLNQNTIDMNVDDLIFFDGSRVRDYLNNPLPSLSVSDYRGAELPVSRGLSNEEMKAISARMQCI
jgi:hypothetical protein